jgi:hypothetical protein
MKKIVFAVLLMGGCFGTLQAELKDDLRYLGYSKDLQEFTVEKLPSAGKRCPGCVSGKTENRVPTVMEEANAVVEQLNELGKTREMTPNMPGRTQETKLKIDEYWKNMQPQTGLSFEPLSPEFKAELKQKVSDAISQAGFEIKQLDLIDVENAPQVRAVLRVVRPLKTQNSYQEIQLNLAEVRNLAAQAATIDGVGYLSEMTTFVAENPRNKYYYEKTILTP